MTIASPKILVITVNFRQPACTTAFLHSAQNLHCFDSAQFLIVDNDSGDDSLELLASEVDGLPNVELIRSTTNRGYFGAARWAFDEYLSEHCLPEWIIVCNNDILFPDPKFLLQLLGQDVNSVGVLAPCVVSAATGLDSNPMISARPSSVRMLRYRLQLANFYIAWAIQWLAPRFRKISRPTRDSSEQPRIIYAPHGSFLIFSRRFFESGGYLDDGSLLFAEELRIAEQCRALGLPIRHAPALRVFHNESQTTGRHLNRDMYRLQKEGLEYTLDKYFRQQGPATPLNSYRNNVGV